MKMIFKILILCWLTCSVSFAEEVVNNIQPTQNTTDQPNQFIASLAKIGNCSTLDPQTPCSIALMDGVTFLKAIKICNSLSRWTIIYKPNGVQLSFELTSSPTGECFIKGIDSSNPNAIKEKSCALMPETISSMTSDQSLAAMAEYTKTGKTTSDVIQAVKPLYDCIGTHEVSTTNEVRYFNKP